MKLPHHTLRKTPELVYAWFDRDLQRRKKMGLRINESAGKRFAQDGKVFIIFPDGKRRPTGEELNLPKRIPLLSDLPLDRESRLALG